MSVLIKINKNKDNQINTLTNLHLQKCTKRESTFLATERETDRQTVTNISIDIRMKDHRYKYEDVHVCRLTFTCYVVLTCLLISFVFISYLLLCIRFLYIYNYVTDPVH